MTEAYLLAMGYEIRVPLAAAAAPAPEEDPLSPEVARRNFQAIKGLMAQVPGAARTRG